MESPHGDGLAQNGKNYVHCWEYSLSGVGGEELVLYKGVQTVTAVTLPAPDDDITDTGRRVYLSAFKYYAAGGELQFTANGTREIHISDNLGSVRCVITGTGTEIKSYDYKPYGELEWSSTGTQERKGFATAEYDGESDYYTICIRMYLAEFGHFLAVDPLFEVMPRHTPYHYGFSSPLVYCDPSGLAPEKEKNGEKLQTLYSMWGSAQEYYLDTPNNLSSPTLGPM